VAAWGRAALVVLELDCWAWDCRSRIRDTATGIGEWGQGGRHDENRRVGLLRTDGYASAWSCRRFKTLRIRYKDKKEEQKKKQEAERMPPKPINMLQKHKRMLWLFLHEDPHSSTRILSRF
jgi:hypothetical protein